MNKNKISLVEIIIENKNIYNGDSCYKINFYIEENFYTIKYSEYMNFYKVKDIIQFIINEGLNYSIINLSGNNFENFQKIEKSFKEKLKNNEKIEINFSSFKVKFKKNAINKCIKIKYDTYDTYIKIKNVKNGRIISCTKFCMRENASGASEMGEIYWTESYDFNDSKVFSIEEIHSAFFNSLIEDRKNRRIEFLNSNIEVMKDSIKRIEAEIKGIY